MLADRLNQFPQGVFPSKLLYKILEMLFSEKEAKLVSLLPLRPFTAKKAGQAWKMDRVNARKILDRLCSRAILVDIEENGRQVYCLPPIKQAMASQQMKSIYLEALFKRFNF
jgi:hypothetical protein